MIAERVYRRLLRFYPAAFRDRYGRQMQILFRDLYRERQREHSLAAILIFWHHIVTDLIANAWRERIDSMKPQNMITPAIAGLFLLVPFVFLLSGLFGYSLGIEAARWPVDILYPDSASEGRDSLTDMVILLGPVVAVALLGFSLLRSGWDDRANGMQAVLVLANSHRITTGMLLVGLTIGAAFMLYGLVENWPCLIGQQIQC